MKRFSAKSDPRGVGFTARSKSKRAMFWQDLFLDFLPKLSGARMAFDFRMLWHEALGSTLREMPVNVLWNPVS
jgi:hypothetical protein